MVVISDNAGTRGGTLIGKEHGTGMNDDWKSPKASIFDSSFGFRFQAVIA